MIKPLRRLGFACLAAAFFASPVIAQYHAWSDAGVPCGCGGYPAPYVRVRANERPYIESYRSQSYPSAVMAPSPARAGTRQFSSQYHTPDEARSLYHPVVVPLDEFLNPREPVALSPEELARQRAAAEARAIPPQPAPGAIAPARTPEADPFADDAPAAGEPSEATAPAAPADGSTDAPVQPTEEEASAEEGMPAEQPEAELPPEAEASPADEPAEADPFESIE